MFIWGFTAILGDLISKEAFSLVWNRIAITLLALLAYIAFSKKKLTIKRSELGLMALGGVLIAAHWITFFHAIKISNVSVTLVCLSSGAFFASVLEPIFYKRKLLLAEVLLGSIVIAAIAMIFTLRLDYAWGIITALSSAFLSASFSVLNGKLTHHHQPETITFYELLSGWLAISIWLIFSGEFSLSLLPNTTSDWIFLFILGTICTAYPFVESVRVMKHLSPFTVLLSINMEPVYGIILAFFILGDKEHMSPTFYAGAFVIIGVIFANAWLQKRKRRAMLIKPNT